MADVPKHFSDTAQEKSEANDVQIIASKKRKSRKKENVTCPFQVRVRALIRTVNQLTSRYKRSQQNSIYTSFKKFTIFVCIEIRS